MTGKLYLYVAGWQLKETRSDGGDAGCDHFDDNVVVVARPFRRARGCHRMPWPGPSARRGCPERP
ncbi:conserved hypothetical protein [Streptomyces pristinaespiralis ATCC 25486]|uniref:Uncharacterized protein n=1 Tax=Streptomyces pristinaespiralis (strain ATCC 25486 / DSM 40338 / CBS 914.69 / JCM 4507 / KCC S-0507 / NBRC 13074 / NRRL 2958 / 5647) TaxID=457429 RepID=B5HJU9_STRE2|nr:conserved hypothetical protein [Streptomyces pristinaespiralis ATCC 25486]